MARPRWLVFLLPALLLLSSRSGALDDAGSGSEVALSLVADTNSDGDVGTWAITPGPQETTPKSQTPVPPAPAPTPAPSSPAAQKPAPPPVAPQGSPAPAGPAHPQGGVSPDTAKQQPSVAPEDTQAAAPAPETDAPASGRRIADRVNLGAIRTAADKAFDRRSDDMPDPNLYPGAAQSLGNSPDHSPSSSAGGAAGRSYAPEAMRLLKVRDFSGAERNLTAVLRENPSDALAYRLRSLSRQNLKDYAGALADAEGSLRLNPRDPWAHELRALALTRLGKAREALPEANAAIALSPGSATARRTRALAWEKLGRRDEMLADLKRAAELDPQFEALYRGALEERRAPAQEAGHFPPPRAWRGLYALLALGIVLYAALCWRETLRRRRATAPRPMLPPEEPPPHENGIEGFEIVRKLGEGGMGVVYEGVDRALRRAVAIKRMRPEISGDPREKKRFLKEARLVASLQHPNIVTIHSVVEEPDDLYLVFEYLSGMTLDQRLAGGVLAPPQGLGLLRQIGRALDYAHGLGIIHRDLKPANVMLLPEGSAKVMDFGIARQARETLSRLSRYELAGTPDYMSPEQELGRCDKESDIYALGICFYEMLSGRVPFSGTDAHLKKEAKEYPPLSAAAPGVPRKADAVLDKALDPAFSRRPSSAGEFVAALETAFASSPISQGSRT